MVVREGLFERMARHSTRWAGSSYAFALALASIALWAATGPLFGWSDTWQLVINTSTTIVTFLMVFLIQRSQNKDSMALQLKLNEVIASLEGASNRMVNIEELGEKELERLHERYGRLARMAKQAKCLTESHSIEEADRRSRKPGQTKPADAPGEP